MTGRSSRRLPVLAGLLLACVTLAGNGRELARTAARILRAPRPWPGPARTVESPGLDGLRALVRERMPAEDTLRVLRKDPQGLRSEERYVLVALSFDRAPARVVPTASPDVPDGASILVPEAFEPTVYARNGWLVPAGRSDGYALLLSPEAKRPEDGGGPAPEPAALPSAANGTPAQRELLGWIPAVLVLAVCGAWGGWAWALAGLYLYTVLLLFAVVMGAGGASAVPWAAAFASAASPGLRGRCRPPVPGLRRRRGFAFVLSAAVLLFGGLLTLSSTAISPAALGSVGGRARTLWLCGGFPPDFFSDRAREILQPSYPPGAMLLALGADAAGGVAGEWLSRLPFVAALAAFALFAGLRMRRAEWLAPFAALVLSPVPFRLMEGGHPEAFAVLFMAVGLSRILDSDGADGIGWSLLCAAAWFKNEGFVLVLAAAISLWLCGEGGKASIRVVILASLPPVLWFLGVRLAGEGLPDTAPVWNPSAGGPVLAAGWFWRNAILRPWSYAFVFPAGAALAATAVCRRVRPSSADLFLLLSTAGLLSVYAFSRAASPLWHVATSLPRLLWPPAVLFVFWKGTREGNVPAATSK